VEPLKSLNAEEVELGVETSNGYPSANLVFAGQIADIICERNWTSLNSIMSLNRRISTLSSAQNPKYFNKSAGPIVWASSSSLVDD
jgi:hypothetical protein